MWLFRPIEPNTTQTDRLLDIQHTDTGEMERTKGYLDFSPQSAPDTKFVPPKNTMNVIDTKERREHLSAYFGFMRLEVVHLMKEYGKKATRMTCQEVYDRGKRVIPVRYFEYTVDRVMWMLWCEFPDIRDTSPCTDIG
jgi:hypothetical protein